MPRPDPVPVDGDDTNAFTEDQRLAQILAEGPKGAAAVAATAVAIVIAIWFAFYFFVFLPRGPIG